MRELAPVIIFVYARPNHTENMLKSLSLNKLAKESNIYIFADNAKKEKDIPKVKETRKIIHDYQNKNLFKKVEIYETEKNKGLANSVIDGVSKIINKYEKAIVIEDDLILSTSFLEYMNECLELYKENNKIWSISGYNLPIEIPSKYKEEIYLSYRGCSWGWATWVDRWNKVDWDVSDYKKFKHNYKIRKKFNRGGPDMAQMLDAQMKKQCDSWAIRWCYEQSKLNMYTIYPIESLVSNQGLDGTGTHSGTTDKFNVEINNKTPKLKSQLFINNKIIKAFYKKFDYGWKQKIIEICTILRMENIIEGLRRVKNGARK